jgi:hypothetical protein
VETLQERFTFGSATAQWFVDLEDYADYGRYTSACDSTGRKAVVSHHSSYSCPTVLQPQTKEHGIFHRPTALVLIPSHFLPRHITSVWRSTISTPCLLVRFVYLDDTVATRATLVVHVVLFHWATILAPLLFDAFLKFGHTFSIALLADVAVGADVPLCAHG